MTALFDPVARALAGAPCRMPAVMASGAPTFTAQAAGAVSTIANKVFIPVTDARLGVHDAAGLQAYFSAGLNDGVFRNHYHARGLGQWTGTLPFSFQTDADQIDFVLMSSATLQFMVNGQLISATPQTATVGGSSTYIVRLNFATSELREISSNSFFIWQGIYVGSQYTVSPGKLSQKGGAIVASVIGDSYIGGLGTAGTRLSHTLGMMLGLAGVFYDGVGGTGYAYTTTSTTPQPNSYFHRSTAGNAAQNSWAEWGSDIDFVLGGINDQTAITGLTPILTEALVLSVLQARRALFPNAVIVVSGNWWPNEATISSFKATTIQAVIDAAVPQLTGPWVQVNNIAGTWRNSAGASGSLGGQTWQTGSGRQVTFTVAPSAATSATLSSVWGGTTGSYTLVFSDGTTKTATLTNGSAAVSWTGAVTASATVGVRGSTAGNAERFVSSDGTHPSAQGVDYLCMRLAQGTRAGVMAL